MVPYYAIRGGMALGRYGPMAARAVTYGSTAASLYNQGRSIINSLPKRKHNIAKPRKPTPIKKKKYPKSKKLRGFQQGGNEGHTVTTSSVTLSQATKASLKESVPQIFKQVFTSSTTSPEGGQDFNAHCTGLQGTLLNNFAPASLSAQKRFFVKSYARQSMFTNVTSTPVSLDIYELEPKMNLSSDQYPEVLIETSLAKKYDNSNQRHIPYTDITESIAFNKHYKITARKTVLLSPGETHAYNYKCIINRWYNSDESVTTDTAGQPTEVPAFVKGFTKVLFARILGTPVTDGSKISIASSKIISTHNTIIRYNIPQGTAGNNIVAVQDNQFATDLTSEKYMNEDSGTGTTKTTI